MTKRYHQGRLSLQRPWSKSRFPSLSPLPFSHSLLLEVGHLNTARRFGDRCKLPERGLGQSPIGNRILCILALKSESDERVCLCLCVCVWVFIMSSELHIPPSPKIAVRGVARGCGPHRAALARGCKRAKIVFKNSRENSDCNFICFPCNKNKALQLQRVPILSILGPNIGSLAASGSTLLVLSQFCVGTGLYRILVRSFLR